jgi:hypothetical protein
MDKHPYYEKKIALTTKHEKLKLIKPAFDQYIGCELIEINLDTDQLGTFTGEIERKAPPRETAIQKARLGMNAGGLPIGIASEGSVGADSVIGFFNSNVEQLVLVDDEHNLVISESYRSFDILAATITITPDQDISEFLKKADFPNHRLIVRPNSKEKSSSIKGINGRDLLLEAIKKSAEVSPDGSVVIESDLRAMHSPSRAKNIERVAQLLAVRVSQLCPECQLPGWGPIGYETGLNCRECKFENPHAIRQEKLGCVKCKYERLGAVVATSLNPAQCDFCNP